MLFVLGLLLALILSIELGSGLLFFGGIDFNDPGFWYGVLIFTANAGGLFLMAFYAAAARLTFAAENRVFRLRLAMMLQWAVIMASVAPLRFTAVVTSDALVFMALAGCLFWYLCGAAMSGEAPELSLPPPPACAACWDGPWASGTRPARPPATRWPWPGPCPAPWPWC